MIPSIRLITRWPAGNQVHEAGAELRISPALTISLCDAHSASAGSSWRVGMK